MVKTTIFSLFHYNKFIFGQQVVSQFVLFECKYLFSIICFYFHKSNGEQDRFHTHAFNAISFKIFGTYNEYVLDDEITGNYHIEKRTDIIKYFPRDRYHKIGNSSGCLTLLLSGPWINSWKEYICGTNKIVNYKFGRVVFK
jgi:hypothetical protein